MPKRDQAENLDETKRIMGALVRMPPKPHEAMKVGKIKPRKKMTERKAIDKTKHK